MLIRNTWKRCVSLWTRLEEKEISFRVFILLFFAIITVRNLLESFSSTGTLETVGTYVVHYPFNFVIAFLMLTVMLSICSGERIEKISRLMLYLWLLVLIPPVLDLIMSAGGGGERKIIGYVSYEKGRFWWTYANFFNPFVKLKGATAGIRLEVTLACVLSAAYVLIKSRSVVRTLLTPFVISFFSFCFFALPTLYVSASSLITPRIVDSRTLVFQDGFFFRNFSQAVVAALAPYQLVVVSSLFTIWLVIHDPRKLWKLILGLDWLRYAHYLLLTSFGLIVGWRMFLPSAPLSEITGNVRDLLVVKIVSLSLLGVVLFGHALAAVSSKLSGAARDEDPDYDGRDIILVSLIISLVFTAAVSYPVLVWVAALLFLEVVGRVSPFSAFRIPVVGSVVTAAESIACFLLGFTILAGNFTPTLFPASLSLTVGVVFFLRDILKAEDEGGERRVRGRGLTAHVPGTAAVIAAGLLLPGRLLTAGMIGIAAFYILSNVLIRGRLVRFIGPVTYLAAYVFCLFSLWPLLPALSGPVHHFPEELRHSIYATFLDHDGHVEHAELELRKAYDLGSEDPWVASQLGFYALQRGDRETALPFYRRAIELDPADSQALNSTALLLVAMDRVDEAITYWDRLLFDGRDNEPYLRNIASFYVEQHRAGEGLRKFIEADREFRSEEARDAVLLLMSSLSGECTPEELEDRIRAAEESPGDPVSQFVAGAGLQAAGRAGEALPYYNRVEISVPGLRAIFLMEGSAFQAAGDYAKAVAAYRDFLSVYPDNIEGWINLSAACISMGDLEEAVALLEKLSREYPGDPRVNINLANAFLARGDAAKAEEILRRLIERNEETPLAHFNLGVVLEKQGRGKEAFEHYSLAIAGGMAEPVLFTKVGRYLEKFGKKAEALEMYRRALEMDPAFKPALIGADRVSGE